MIDTILGRDYVFKKGSALVPTWTAFAKVQLLERYFSHLIDYEFTAVMEEALDAIARGEGEAEKWLHSFYFGNGQVGLRDLVAEEHIAQIDKAEVNAVHIGTDGDGRELIVRVWPNGANVERGDEKGPVPAELAPDELTPEKADELLALPTGPREAGHRSRDRPHRARAHRPFRSVRATRRPGAGHEGQAQAGVALRIDGPHRRHPGAGARAALAAARRGRRRRRRDHGPERALRAVPQEGHRQPQPAVGGRAVLGVDGRSATRSSRSPSSGVVASPSRRSPSSARTRSRVSPCACSTAASVRTSPTAA